MNKIQFTRDICRASDLRYMIKNDALFVLTYGMDGKRHYKQACYNLLNLTTGQITQMVAIESGKAVLRDGFKKILGA